MRPAYLFLVLALPFSTAMANEIDLGNEPDFLPHEQAFIVSQEQDAKQLTISWHIESGYYLYDHAFDIKEIPNSFIERETSPQAYADDYFGDIEIHENTAVLTIPAAQVRSDELTLTYRGCADAGLCYPPVTVQLPVTATGQPDTSPIAQLKLWAGVIGNAISNAISDK